MADQMTTTGSIGGKNVSAVEDAIETLRQAMIDEGQDPGAVDAKLNAAIPNATEGNLVGNYADLQRLGAIATTGTMPTPPGEEDIQTDNLSDAFVEPQPQDTDAGSGNASPEQVAAAADQEDTRTKAELQAELDSRGIPYTSNDTKADLQAKLG